MVLYYRKTMQTAEFKFDCRLCNFKCQKKSNWEIHLKTKKHLVRSNVEKCRNNVELKKSLTYKCNNCNKLYKARNSLWYHQKKCKKVPKERHNIILLTNGQVVNHDYQINDQEENAEIGTPSLENSFKPLQEITHEMLINTINMNQKLFLENKDFQYKNQELITRIDEYQKNNSELQCKVNDLQHKIDELQNQIVRIATEPKIINNTTTNNNNTTNNYLENNTTNNQFNLSMFLNEECKNAIDLKDFVNSINLTVEDLEETGRLGFIDGLTRIVVNELKKLDVTQRPIHCTDLKRETVYIKDQNQWNKENAEKEHMFTAVNRIVYKNIKMIPIWQQKYPQYNTIEEQYQQYLKISLNSLGPYSDEDTKKQKEKIIRNILKEVLLDRKQKQPLE